MRNRINFLKAFGAPLLNGLLGLLLLILFIQCGVFMGMYAGIRRTSAEVPFDMRMLSASSAESRRSLDPELLAPEFLAVQSDGECRAVFHSAAVVGEMYGEMSECLLNALLHTPAAASAEEWQSAMKGTFAYARYKEELPYQVICAFAASHEDSDARVREAESYTGVREVLLAADQSGNFSVLLVRGANGVYRFPLESTKTAADFTVYPTMYPDAFCKTELRDRGDLCIPVTEASILTRQIYASSGVTTLLTTNQDFLRFLNFNPDKLNYHVESDGTYVYVESHGVLRAGSDEMVYHATESGGIDIAGIGGEGEQDIYAYMRVASYLISRLGSMSYQYIGGDAGLYLDSVRADGESITLNFHFRCDNIELADTDGTHGMTLRFTGDRLTEIRYRMMIIRRTLEENNVMLQSWYKRMLDADDASDMRLVYALNGSSYALTAAWAVIDTPETGEGGDSAWAGQD